MARGRSTFLPKFDLRGGSARAQALVVAAFVAAALLLGGASASGIAANAVLQVAGVVAVAAILMWPSPVALAPGERALLALTGLFVLLYMVQLVPLPPAVWTALPGRGMIARDLGALGLSLPWMPLSLTPEQTLHSAVALCAPVAMLLMIARFQRPVARVAVLAMLGVTLVSILLGVAQFSGSGVYFYAFSNVGSATGFFANANHFAALMCLSMPLAAGLVARWRSEAARGASATRAFAIAFLLAVVLLGLLGIAMTQSVAGVLLALVAVLGSVAIILSGLSRRLRLAFLGGIVLIVVAVGLLVFTGIGGDFAVSTINGDESMGRPMMWRVTMQAISTFGAAGSGFGSFRPVFYLFEDPAQVTPLFANHAHNDLLEFVLEAGVPGVVLLLLFLGWFGWRVAQIWLLDRQRDPLAQGAVIAATIVLLHSLVDYPLRTGAIATIFALCLALMARSVRSSNDEGAIKSLPGRHLSA